MAKNLVIVESPAKAKTIEGYLGKDFLVKSSFGHVRDLSSKGLAIDIENDFQPAYEVSADKRKIIQELQKLAKQAETVWLASDEDREGEAIAWHLAESLNLAPEKTKRIVFNEITKTAILKAIENPRGINQNLVNAQQARRILDRLVGYEISPILWKKVKPSLSAGRVQSVAVRLIVERERERNAFNVESFYRVNALFITEGAKVFKAELSRRLKSESEVESFLKKCAAQSLFTVATIETRPAKRTPAAPFTTSTLQQEASRKLSFGVARTMQLAQRLYESGKITYMRTDSVNLSDFALEHIKNTIANIYGMPYHKERRYATKSKGAQEAHECIRPTDMALTEAGSDSAERRLYDLIWKRTIASQMSDAELEKTQVKIPAPEASEFQAKGEVIRFDGFLKVYLEGSDDEDENEDDKNAMLPAMKEGEKLGRKEIIAVQRFSQLPSRYTEASLVKKLEELGIGRPSTYAPTISTILKRGYVVKEDREGVQRSFWKYTLVNADVNRESATETTGAEKSKLFPTDIGTVVTDFLVEHFSGILDYNFTASVEKEFDEIASGLISWEKMIDGFYGPFHARVVKTEEVSTKATGKRLLGHDPNDGKPVYALVGRYGPMVQIGESEDEEKPRFASLRKEQSIQTISMAEAMDLFALPRNLGEFEGKDVIVGVGRFGPYIRHNSKFISIPKGLDPLEVELERAIELIQEKRISDANKIMLDFPGEPHIQVLRGRWGPYIVVGKENVKIPKGTEAEALSRDECLAIYEAAPKKAASATKTLKSTAKKKKS